MSNEAVPRAPAPWQLRGNAWILALSLPEEEIDRTDFLPPALHGRRVPGSQALLMVVDYQYSDVGPYHEILFVPGRFRFPDGSVRPTISRILVSTEDSVINGRENWGIPKEKADFRLERDGSTETIEVRQQGDFVARLVLKSYPPPMPAPGKWLPRRWRSLAQHRNGATWHYAPGANGIARPARLLDSEFDPQRFPDATRGRTLAAARLTGFNMTFPEAESVRDPQ